MAATKEDIVNVRVQFTELTTYDKTIKMPRATYQRLSDKFDDDGDVTALIDGELAFTRDPNDFYDGEITGLELFCLVDEDGNELDEEDADAPADEDT